MAIAVGASIGAATGGAASAGTVVGASVPSATEVTTSGCTTGTADVTDFGTVLPGSAVSTSSDCVVSFGASNDTAMLRLRQLDGYGSAMWRVGTGAIDTSYDGDSGSSNGIVRLDPGLGADEFESAALRADGRAVLVGTVRDGSARRDSLVVSLDPDGTTDGTFGGGDGIVTIPVHATNHDRARAVAVQGDGKIVVVGETSNGADNDAYALRLLTDGTLDPTFGSGGIRTFARGFGVDDFRGVIIDRRDRIVITGKTRSAANEDMWVVRLHSDGQPDSTFGTNGVLVIDVGAWEASSGILEARDGDYVLAGDHVPTDAESVLVRIDASGSLDTSFDGDPAQPGYPGNGIARYDLLPAANDWLEVASEAPDGDLVVSGRAIQATEDAIAVRVTATGALDSTFDGDGWMVTRSTAGTDRGDGAPVIGSDGSITLGGLSGSDGWVSRLSSTGVLDTTFGSSGVRLIDSGVGNDEIKVVLPTVEGGLLAVGWWSTGASTDAVAVQLAGGGTVPDYANTTTDWDAGSGMFGSCLSSVAAGASAVWTASGGCPAVDGAHWRSVPTAASTVAQTTVSGTTGAQARMRFGFRPGTSTSPGRYEAPLLFDVVAP